MPAQYLARASFISASAALALLIVTAAACGGSQTEPQTPDPITSSPPTQPDDPGPTTEDAALLDVIADRETEILLDGKPIGKTPISAYKVTPGTHDVTFVDERNGNRTMTVTVGANEAKTVKSDLPPQIQEQGGADGDKKK